MAPRGQMYWNLRTPANRKILQKQTKHKRNRKKQQRLKTNKQTNKIPAVEVTMKNMKDGDTDDSSV